MKSLLNIVILLFVIALLAVPVFAQNESTVPVADFAIPTILAGLAATNFKLTEAFKRMLESKDFGSVPSKDVQGVLVLTFSVGFGIVSAWATPQATEWLPVSFQAYPLFAIVITGFSVSTVGSIVYEVLRRLNVGTVYSTRTTISSPSTGSSDETNKNVMSAVSQAVKK